jgi:hypothetical protein
MTEFEIFGLTATQMGLVVVLLAPLSLQILALIDIAGSDFPGNRKLIWLFVLILLPLAGFILYFAFGRKQRLRKTPASTGTET